MHVSDLPGSVALDVGPNRAVLMEYGVTMPMNKKIKQVEEDLKDWELVDRIERLGRWIKKCSEPEPSLTTEGNDKYRSTLKEYFNALWDISRAYLQLTMMSDFTFYQNTELKEQLRNWLQADQNSLEYKKARLFIQGMTEEGLKDEIKERRATIDLTATEVAKGLVAINRRPDFEFWPVLTTGESPRPLVAAPAAVASPKPNQGTRNTKSHGGFQELIEASILWLQSRNIKPTYKKVAALIVVDAPGVLAILPDEYKLQILAPPRFAGTLLQFIEAEEAAGNPINFRHRFMNMYSLVKRRRENNP